MMTSQGSNAVLNSRAKNCEGKIAQEPNDVCHAARLRIKDERIEIGYV